MARRFIRRPLSPTPTTVAPAEIAARNAAMIVKARAMVDAHGGRSVDDVDVSDLSVAAVEAAIAYAEELGLVAETHIVKRRVMLRLAA